MKAKLIKKDGHYFLEIEPNTWTLPNRFHSIIANTLDKPKGEILQLSLKNCQAIERSYDLDDCVDYFEKGKLYIQQDGVIILAGENGNNGIIIQDPLETRGVGHYSDEWNPKAFCEFKQKAVELIGDKRFTLEDMMNCWNKALTFQTHKKTLGEHIQSLQQTEWNVEIETETCQVVVQHGDMEFQDFPKLDADGCLILKPKSE